MVCHGHNSHAERKGTPIANWDYQLVSRIIQTGDLSGVIDWGITMDDMLSSETKAMFERLMSYYHNPETQGAVWGPMALQNMFPTFPRYDDPSMTTDALCKESRTKRIEAQTRTIIKQFEDVRAVDPMSAVAYLQKAATDLHNDCASKKVDVHFADAFSRVVHAYGRVEQGERICVATWPWGPIQSKTLGIKHDDYIVLYGRPKSMKSWTLCYLIAWCICQGQRVLIYTKEMPTDEVFERVGCCIAGVDYERFTTGTLTPEEKVSIYTVLNNLRITREMHSVICLSGQDARYKDTVMWLEAKIEKYRPTIVFVDGMYLMTPVNKSRHKHERVADISQDMRQLVLRRHVPVIATVQANRKAAENEESNSEDVAFSDSLGQDATMLIRVVNEHKKGQSTLALVMGGTTRRFKLDGFRINAKPAYDFSYFGELTAGDAEKAVAGDDTTAKTKGSKGPGRRSPKNDELDNANRSADAC